MINICNNISLLNLLTPHIAHSLSFINEIALGLILFNIGGEFHKKLLKEIGKHQALYSFTLAILIFFSVSLIAFTITFFTIVKNFTFPGVKLRFKI